MASYAPFQDTIAIEMNGLRDVVSRDHVTKVHQSSLPGASAHTPPRSTADNEPATGVFGDSFRATASEPPTGLQPSPLVQEEINLDNAPKVICAGPEGPSPPNYTPRGDSEETLHVPDVVRTLQADTI